MKTRKAETLTRAAGNPPLGIKRILVPVDFSKESAKALRYALALASELGAEVTAVHIIEQLVYPGDGTTPLMVLKDFAAERESEIIAKLRDFTNTKSAKVKHIARTGRAWQQITKVAEKEKTDLIVISTHGYTGLRHVLIGSVAEKVVRHAPCPVLVVR